MLQSELVKFAKWFHQDFGVLFGSLEKGTNEYLSALSDSQKNELFKEIGEMLKKYPGKDHKGLKSAWLKLGAQWWRNDEMPNWFRCRCFGICS